MTKRHRRAAEFKNRAEAELWDQMLKDYSVTTTELASLVLSQWLVDTAFTLVEKERFDNIVLKLAVKKREEA